MLAPIMIMLGVKAADPRSTPAEKQRSLKLLRQITPEFVLTAGLSTDFNAEVLRFLRLFDHEDPDPAQMRWATQLFTQRLKALFTEAGVLREIEGQPAEYQTATVQVVRLAMEMPPVYVDAFCFNPWPDSSLSVRGPAVLESIQTVVDLTVRRVRAELPFEGLHADLSVFDLRWYKKALDAEAAGKPGSVAAFQDNARARVARLPAPHTCSSQLLTGPKIVNASCQT